MRAGSQSSVLLGLAGKVVFCSERLVGTCGNDLGFFEFICSVVTVTIGRSPGIKKSVVVIHRLDPIFGQRGVHRSLEQDL